MVFFVTGGSRGVGAGIVRALVGAGHAVAFTYNRSRAEAEALVAELAAASPAVRCEAFQLDVRVPADVEQVGDAVLERFGAVDVVVCNAGINRDGLAAYMRDDDWREVIDTNLSGSFYVARQFLPELLQRRRGRLIFISSIAQWGISGQVNYAASKGGLVGLSAALAKEYGRRGITSNVLVLGVMDTGMATASLSDDYASFVERFTPVGRRGTVDDVAGAVLFLASDAASFVTGQELGVNGGATWGP